jgi:hypothetical protein
MFHLKCLLLSMCLLGSSLCLVDEALSQKRTGFGLANIEVVAVGSSDDSHILPHVVVRIAGRKNKVQSYGLSNESGIIVMPLPPGSYCYDAFSEAGVVLNLRRKASERCFSIEKDSYETIGVEVVKEMPK